MGAVKRLLLAVAVIVVGFLAVRQLVIVLASDETKIEWLIEDMADGFNDAHAGDAVEGLAKDWRHEGSGIDRPTLQAALFQEFRSFGESKRGRETYRVEVLEDLLTIRVDGETATVAGEAEFARAHEDEWSTVWRIRFAAELANGEAGWEIGTSRHENLEGWGLR